MRALAFAIVTDLAISGCTFRNSTTVPPTPALGTDAIPAPHRGMHMAQAVLYTATATSDQVVRRRASAASATAAVITYRTGNELRYEITFHGLEYGAPSRIALYNFGAGGEGLTVVALCGGDAEACPPRPSARIAGSITALPLTNRLVSELVSSRIYVQIDGGDGRPEIRGQLATNGAMVPVRNYLASLDPVPGGTGQGTAVLSETYLPQGRVAVHYSVTVAGTSGAPEEISLTGVDPSDPVPSARFLRSARLPISVRALSSRARGGGTFSGRYVARRTDRSAVLAVNLLGAGSVPAIAVRTSRFPRGELVGRFTPVE